MRPTFFGFEAARSGLTAAQAGLDTTGNNIANLSTEGYSRQVVDQVSTYLGSSSDKVAPSGQMFSGLGATVRGIEQVRSQFLDLRYRDANSENSANGKILSILTDIENNFDETQTTAERHAGRLHKATTGLVAECGRRGILQPRALQRPEAGSDAQINTPPADGHPEADRG